MAKRKLLFRILAGFGAGMAILIGVGAWYLNWMMNQPLFAVGSVRNEADLRSPLQPPKQADDGWWQVESDIKLKYESFGTGEPVLVVHGGPGIPYESCWKGLEPLQESHEFYFYHQRGCGDSSRPLDRLDGDFYSNMMQLEETLGLGSQIADIERIRRILGVEKLTIIGHSYGGFIAALYAAEFPDRVAKLVLVAPAGVLAPPSDETDIFVQARSRLNSERRASFDAVKAEYFDFANIFSKSDEQLVELHDKIGGFLLEAMGYDAGEHAQRPKSGGWAVFALYFSGGRKPNFLPALQAIKAPTLIVHGKDDDIAMAGSRMYAAIPDSRFELLERDQDKKMAGHMPFDDAPQAFATAVQAFLAP